MDLFISWPEKKKTGSYYSSNIPPANWLLVWPNEQQKYASWTNMKNANLYVHRIQIQSFKHLDAHLWAIYIFLCVRGFLVSLTHQIDLSVRYTVFNLVYREQSSASVLLVSFGWQLTDNRVCILDSCVFNNDVIVTEKMWRWLRWLKLKFTRILFFFLFARRV